MEIPILTLNKKLTKVSFADIAKTKDFTSHNDSSLHQNLNTSDNLFSDILSEEIEKVKGK